MKRWFLLYIAFLIFFLKGSCQDYAATWYFGEHSGLIFGEDASSITNPSFIAEAGCAVISDSSGNLLFYTNGREVWNKNHVQMQNGGSLKGSPQLNQNSIIVPHPGDKSLYYLFTINDQDSLKGFYYSIVDMNADNGLGGISVKNIYLRNDVIEKISGVIHCNENDYWVIVHNTENTFYSYLITDAGLTDQIIESETGTSPKADVGYMKMSPRGDMLILPVNREDLLAEVFDFDRKTGTVSNPMKINANEEDTYCYGTSFSPSGELLYLTTRGKDYSVWQYNMSPQSIDLSGIQIATGNNFAMQLGPDGKIYIASENRPYLNIIAQPDREGLKCEYISQGIKLENSYSLMGLPNFIQSWFFKPDICAENLCLGDTTCFTFEGYYAFDSSNLKVYDSLGNMEFFSKDFPAFYRFDKKGEYSIHLDYYQCGNRKSAAQKFTITEPPASQTVYENIYSGFESITLDAGEGFDSYFWSTGDTNQQENIFQSGVFIVEKLLIGCVTIDTFIVNGYIYEPYLPSAFTPNNDGINDCFGLVNPIDGMGIKLMVFSRFGQLLFESDDPFDCWDGVYNGTVYSTGTYVYKVSYNKYENGNFRLVQKNGTVTIIR